MLDKDSTRREMMSKVMISVLAGMVIWVGLLVLGASAAKVQADGTMYEVAFGPLTLHTITTQKVTSGTNAAVSMEAGLLWYMACWALLGIGLSLLSGRVKRPRSDTPAKTPL